MARGMKRPQGHRGLVDGGGDGGGGSGGITSITSPDSSVTVTNPTGPVVSLEVAATDVTLFDLFLSYGHGMAVDANLPALGSFWFSPTTIADLATAAQVREWVTVEALAFLELVVRLDAAHLVTGGGSFIVTVDGLDTAIALAVATGDTTATTLETSVAFSVAAGSTVGVRWDGSAAADGSTMRAEIHLRGASGGTPIVPSTLPGTPLALFRPEDLALDGSSWVDSVAGNLYTCTVPSSSVPPGWIQPISGPTRVDDGSFNGNPYGHFTNYNDPLFGVNYTPNMLATHVAMFAGSAAPIAPRTLVAVCRPGSAIGGIVGTTQFTTPCFKGALYKPAGDLAQAVYFTVNKGATQTDSLITPVNYGTQELVLIWRTDGTTLEFFIDGVKQTLDTSVIGTDAAAGGGFCIGNLASATYTSEDGFRGDIAFEGVWARKFTDAEVLSATANLAALYVTP